MKVFICILAFALTVEAGLLPHGHVDEIAPHYDALHHGDVHISHSPAIVIEENGVSITAADVHHHADLHHADLHHADLHHADLHHHADVHHEHAAKIVHHEPIHQVDPVHHVTKVVHHEPHHFVHYTKPVVDHHFTREVAHLHSAPLVHHHGGHHASYYSHGSHSALGYYSALGKHLHHYSPYSKLRVIEKHY